MKKGFREKLGLKIVPKEQALWERIRDARKATIAQYEEALIIEREFLALAEKKIEELKN
jgi:hypothetical protein